MDATPEAPLCFTSRQHRRAWDVTPKATTIHHGRHTLIKRSWHTVKSLIQENGNVRVPEQSKQSWMTPAKGPLNSFVAWVRKVKLKNHRPTMS